MIRLVIFDAGDTLLREQPDFTGRLVDAPHLDSMPHVEAALAALRPVYRLVVGSNADVSTSADMRAALRRMGLDGYFEQVFSSKSLGVRKPDPAFFRAVLDACGIPSGEAVMVGDTFSTDIAGAKGFGLRAVWYNWKNAALPPGSEHLAPDATIRDLADLPAALRALDGG